MKKSIVLSLSVLGVLGSCVVACFVSDIALFIFGSAAAQQERMVMLALLVLQVSSVSGLARCICRQHCADLRGQAS